MTTIINSPGSGESSGAGLAAGIIVAVMVIAFFFIFALPAIQGDSREGNSSIDVNLKLPGGDDNSAPQSTTY